MDPFRLRVLMALTDAFKGITPANGYQHDLSEAVFRGRPTFTDDDPVPMVSILEAPKAPEQLETSRASASQQTILPLIVQGFAEDDPDNPTDPAYRLLADVQKCLVVERQREQGFDILGQGSRLMDLQIGRGVVRPPDAVTSDTAFFWLQVTLTLAEDLLDPFA